MEFNPNSKKHKATHGGYYKKITKAKAKATFDFFDTSDLVDFFKVTIIVSTPEEWKSKLGTQLELF